MASLCRNSVSKMKRAHDRLQTQIHYNRVEAPRIFRTPRLRLLWVFYVGTEQCSRDRPWRYEKIRMRWVLASNPRHTSASCRGRGNQRRTNQRIKKEGLALLSLLRCVIVLFSERSQERHFRKKPIAEIYRNFRGREEEPRNERADEHIKQSHKHLSLLNKNSQLFSCWFLSVYPSPAWLVLTDS